jgi:diphosphoinositol-polyphosphate diphosphatase
VWKLVTIKYKMVKDKPNSIRVYDDDGYRKRAACVCVKENDQNQVG